MKSFKEFFNDRCLVAESLLKHLNFIHYNTIINENIEDGTPGDEEDIAINPNATPEEANKVASNFAMKKGYLTPNEELELIKTYKDNKNTPESDTALQTIIENKLKYIQKIVGSFVRQGKISQFDYSDKVQDGVLYLIEAVNKFDSTKTSYGFTPYFRQYLIGKLKNDLNIDRSQDLMSGRAGEVQSMDAEISGDRGEYADKDEKLEDKIADNDDSYQPDSQMIDNEERALLRELIKQLDPIDQTVINMAYLQPEPATLQEISAKIGMSIPAARYRREQAILKLQQALKQYGTDNDQNLNKGFRRYKGKLNNNDYNNLNNPE